MLETEGLTQFEVNKGARVPAFDRANSTSSTRCASASRPSLCRLSLRHLTAEQERELAELQDRIEASIDVGTFLDLDRQFHLLTYAGCPVPSCSPR